MRVKVVKSNEMVSWNPTIELSIEEIYEADWPHNKDKWHEYISALEKKYPGCDCYGSTTDELGKGWVEACGLQTDIVEEAITMASRMSPSGRHVGWHPKVPGRLIEADHVVWHSDPLGGIERGYMRKMAKLQQEEKKNE